MNSYTEFYNKSTGLIMGVEEVLFSGQSEFQKVEVLKTDTWGNLLSIDGMVMLSEKDEFVYHEMITHPALFAHPNPQKVLIIGGGDGGTVREVVKHSTVQQVDLVEIDEMVIEASKAHFPGMGTFEHPALTVKVENGIEYVKQHPDEYDVVIVDGSDPVGPAKDLFGMPFLKNCKKALREGGILICQTESPWIEAYHESMTSVFADLKQLFNHSRMYLGFIPLYPAGMWSFSFSSDSLDPTADLSVVWKERGIDDMNLKYYNPAIHQGAFALPNFVAKLAGE